MVVDPALREFLDGFNSVLCSEIHVRSAWNLVLCVNVVLRGGTVLCTTQHPLPCHIPLVSSLVLTPHSKYRTSWCFLACVRRCSNRGGAPMRATSTASESWCGKCSAETSLGRTRRALETSCPRCCKGRGLFSTTTLLPTSWVSRGLAGMESPRRVPHSAPSCKACGSKAESRNMRNFTQLFGPTPKLPTFSPYLFALGNMYK